MVLHSFPCSRWLYAGALAIALGEFAHAQQRLSEAAVIAAFVYSFARLVDWPRSVFTTPESPLVIGLLGRDPVEASLPSLEKKRVKERRIEVRPIASVEDALACPVVCFAMARPDAHYAAAAADLQQVLVQREPA